MKFSKILVAAYVLFASVGAMAIVIGEVDCAVTPTASVCLSTSVGTPVDDLALLGLAVAALVAGAGIIRRKK